MHTVEQKFCSRYSVLWLQLFSIVFSFVIPFREDTYVLANTSYQFLNMYGMGITTMMLTVSVFIHTQTNLLIPSLARCHLLYGRIEDICGNFFIRILAVPNALCYYWFDKVSWKNSKSAISCSEILGYDVLRLWCMILI